MGTDLKNSYDSEVPPIDKIRAHDKEERKTSNKSSQNSPVFLFENENERHHSGRKLDLSALHNNNSF